MSGPMCTCSNASCEWCELFELVLSLAQDTETAESRAHRAEKARLLAERLLPAARAAAVREVFERTGFKTEAGRLLGITGERVGAILRKEAADRVDKTR